MKIHSNIVQKIIQKWSFVSQKITNPLWVDSQPGYVYFWIFHILPKTSSSQWYVRVQRIKIKFFYLNRKDNTIYSFQSKSWNGGFEENICCFLKGTAYNAVISMTFAAKPCREAQTFSCEFWLKVQRLLLSVC